jgi:hypothetical protein
MSLAIVPFRMGFLDAYDVSSALCVKELTRFRQRFFDSAFWILAVESFLSAVITFGGMKLSITTGDWSWFARSGALVTAFLVTISFTRMNRQFRLGFRLVKAELEYANETQGI